MTRATSAGSMKRATSKSPSEELESLLRSSSTSRLVVSIASSPSGMSSMKSLMLRDSSTASSSSDSDSSRFSLLACKTRSWAERPCWLVESINGSSDSIFTAERLVSAGRRDVIESRLEMNVIRGLAGGVGAASSSSCSGTGGYHSFSNCLSWFIDNFRDLQRQQYSVSRLVLSKR